MKLVKGNNQAGFSLVELMVVVGIIGILASLAVPRLQTFTAKAKISEGKAVVSNMYTLQSAYYAENSVYVACPGGAAAACNQVGFNRPIVANSMNYANPSAAPGGVNRLIISAGIRRNICSGVTTDPADQVRAGSVRVNMNDVGTMGFGGEGRATNVAPTTFPAAGANWGPGTPGGGIGSASPQFTCL